MSSRNEAQEDGVHERMIERRSGNGVTLQEMKDTLAELLAGSVQNQQAWAFEKRISVGNLLTMLFLLAALFGAWSTMDKRVVKLESSSEVQARTDDRQERQSELARLEIRAELDKINIKLDRLNERKP